MAKIVIFNFPEPLSDSSHRQHFLEDNSQPQWEDFFRACGRDKPNLQTVTTLQSAILTPKQTPVIISGHGKSFGGMINKWLKTHVKRNYQFTLLLRPSDFYGDSVALRQHFYDTKLCKHEIIAVHEHFQTDKDFWEDKIKKGK